ncbi:MAG: carbohydrate ABC transporter permease [Candidatus Izimaplasma sp.]|nr:carbohydrate ABC transporter permease [Candidatus Izimaplasma bacterium]
MGNKEFTKRVVVYMSLYFGLIVLVAVSMVPFVMVLMNATRSGQAIQENGLSLSPGGYFVENWETLKLFTNITSGFFNSLFISTSVTVLSAYFSALTAFGFYIYKFKANKYLFAFIVIFMMVPVQLAFLGFYEFMSVIGLVDTRAALIIPAVANVGTVFFLRQYAAGTINKEVIESARMDGANEIYIFHRIGFPLMMPGIATMSIFTFIASWNNYLGARVILNSPEKFTLPLQLANLKGSQVWYENQGPLYMGLFISIFPIVITFIIFSRYLVDSIAAGAVKG